MEKVSQAKFMSHVNSRCNGGGLYTNEKDGVTYYSRDDTAIAKKDGLNYYIVREDENG